MHLPFPRTSLHHLLRLTFLALVLLHLPHPTNSLPSPDDPDPPPPDSDTPPSSRDPPCTATSPHTSSFFDLRPLIRTTAGTATLSSADDDAGGGASGDWFALGYDYNANFTLNICAPVLADTSTARGIDGEYARGNVSAFYERDGDLFSIGQASSTLLFRGKKLILEYTNGSPCGDSSSSFRKSALISFLCDRETLLSKPSVAFVGQSQDCAYFFEIRTVAACPTFKAQESLSPIAVFAIIGGVFAVVYCVGGCVYQRTVMNARGWRQVPHYHAWAGVVGFFSDLFAALVRTLFRRGRPSRFSTGGGSSLSSSSAASDRRSGATSSFSRRLNAGFAGRGGGGGWGSWGRGGSAGGGGRAAADEVEDENRLLDELDEEWGDE
ncbi:mannose-6-phosphate receptor binding domain-containing protein [Kalaharituber pfeilii]|nr:mannose-6-phosphate receptor binding domain-containing protein [Kalaharituber pfeilii]